MLGECNDGNADFLGRECDFEMDQYKASMQSMED